MASETPSVGAPEAEASEPPDVFISYARSDREVVLRLAAALDEAGWIPWIDAEDIPPTSDWSDEIDTGIRTAHTFVFVVSPRSVRSEYCRRELSQAIGLGKRLIPVVVEETEGVPEPLAARQYVYLRPADDFDAATKTLVEALGTDLEWVRAHRQWLTGALRWDASGRDRSLLLRGNDLKSAEAWLTQGVDHSDAQPTRLQTEFLIASRGWQTRRLQMTVASVVVALAVSVALGVLALLQRNAARREAEIAQSRELAIASNSQLPTDPELALLLAIHAVEARHTPEADTALRRAVAARLPAEEVTLGGTTADSLVTDLAFSPDGREVAAAVSDGAVGLVQRAGRGGRVTHLVPPPASVTNPCTATAIGQGGTRVAFSPDGRMLVASGSSGRMTVWRLGRPGPPVVSSLCPGHGTLALRFAGNRSIEAVEGNTLLIWGWKAGSGPLSLPLESAAPTATAFSGSDSVVIARGTGSVSVWRAGLSTPLGAIKGVDAIAAARDGSAVAAAHGGVVTVWRRGATRPLTLDAGAGAGDPVRGLAVSDNGSLLAIGTEEGSVQLWKVSAATAPTVLAVSAQPVTALAFSRNGKWVAASGDDGVLRVWRTATERRGKGIALGVDGRVLRASAREPHRVEIGSVQLRDVPAPAMLSADADGGRAVEAAGNAVDEWDVSRSALPHALLLGGSELTAEVSPDGRWVASGELFGLRLLRWPDLRPAVLDEGSAYKAVAFNADSTLLAGAAYNGKASTVAVWSLGPSHPPRIFHAAVPAYVSSLAFSSDGRSVLASLDDGSTRVWTLGDATPVVLHGVTGFVNDAAFSPDGSAVATTDGDDVDVWMLSDGAGSIDIPAGVGSTEQVAFSHSGDSLDVVGTQGTAVLPCNFCGPIDKVLVRAEHLTTRALTPAEQHLYLHS